jgi:hypothetical protein
MSAASNLPPTSPTQQIIWERGKTMMKATTNLILALSLGVFVAAGCGDDEQTFVLPTVTPVPVDTPIPTATPDDGDDHEHRELEIGSTEDGAGHLAAEFDFDEAIALFFNECFGGEGDECEGGTVLYSVVNPGFVAFGGDDHEDEAETAGMEHEDEIYPLDPGTQISIEVIAIDEGLSMRFEDQVLENPGDTYILGETPDFHGDAETFLLLPHDEEGNDFHLTFRLRAGTSPYEISDDLTLRFFPEEGNEHHEEGKHDEEEGHE